MTVSNNQPLQDAVTSIMELLPYPDPVVHKRLVALVALLRIPASLNGLPLALLFHETYEDLAPSFGYETRQETSAFDPESANSKLMVATCERVLAALPTLIQGWQPIDTAPKDGTEIDLWVVFSDRGCRWADASWKAAGRHKCKGPANWTSREGFPLHAYLEKPTATHWRPVPGGPLIEEKMHD